MAFKPGQSGNPEGARLHKARAARAELRRALLDAAPAVVAVLIKQAKTGDPAALKLFLDRVSPALRPTAEDVGFTLPVGTLLDQARALLQQAADGEVPMDIASQAIADIARLVPLEQHGELKAQLDMLTAEHFKGIA